MFERLLEHGTYRIPRVVSEGAPLSTVGIPTDMAQGIEISVGFPQKLQATVMTLPLCFSAKYTSRLEKKLRDTDCPESRSDRLSSWERPNVLIGPEVRLSENRQHVHVRTTSKSASLSYRKMRNLLKPTGLCDAPTGLTL